MDEEIHFYMQKVNNDGSVAQDDTGVKDLEVDFNGMRYSRAKGMDSLGESRVYEEAFAEEERVNVYVPKNIVHKATKVEMTFFFIGDERRAVREAFEAYVTQGFHKYWDTKRKKSFVFYVKDKIDTAEEKWYGNIPYTEVTYKFTNVKGHTDNV